MKYKNLVQNLGFTPKENTSGIFSKKYAVGYVVELDFNNEAINYGKKIKVESRTTQNFSQTENWVVLECVDRLLEKKYKPENIILEKTYPSGHGHSGRLDICVTHDDGSEYLLIECKTWGKEFDKEFSRMNKDGGQLFTYFKFSNKADLIMLYASKLDNDKVLYRNEIVKIEDDYRTGDVKDFYSKWNKLTKDNGVFDTWVTPYQFISKAFTPASLKAIRQEDSSFIFNQFLEILRHNVVSDKPNAFNKIFTLFLCKIYDEKTTPEGEELDFQWLEGIDDDISFQTRLTDLYKNGMYEFLEKKVTDFSEDDFDRKYASLFADNENLKKQLKDDIIKLRLEKNNEFAIKEVFDPKSFKENAKVVRQVVELLQGYKIRYAKKQQYLSDFFELLLTTGLKQESGQFFTPVPIAQFIIKSIPINELVEEKLQKGKQSDLLPYTIDYAAGSGHFVTEIMHEVQRILDKKDASKYISDTAKKIKTWQNDHFDWAFQYVYGIEKDYRLVKVGKVGCYLHGDGLANVIHSDGLGNFTETKEFKGKLSTTDTDFPKENKQFDIVVSNPPYSVQAFKQNARNYYTEKDFDIYKNLTDNSSEIECLFVERTKQLLKDGGMAGIILPSSILSNTGIYTKAREVILENFDIIAITEFGSNTFMATGTNTVTLFLRRRNNYVGINLRKSVEKFFTDLRDVTLNRVENPVAKYIAHAWERISFDDYKTFLQKKPNEIIKQHEIYQEYQKKIKAKNEQEKWHKILEVEKEKIFYFVLAYPQKIVIVKSGQKTAEKQFLGYSFSNRRGSEGIHPVQRGKNIDECTQLFDPDVFDNPKKASTYIYKAFKGDFDFPVDESLEKNISRANLVDLFTFDRVDFEKNISLAAKKKVSYEEIWSTPKLKTLSDVAEIKKGTSITLSSTIKGRIPVIAGGKTHAYFHSEANREGNIITISASGAHAGFVNYFNKPIFASDCNTIQSNDESIISTKLIYLFLKSIQNEIYGLQRGQAQPHVYGDDLAKIKIPFPPKDIQEKIVTEIETLERQEKNKIKEIQFLKTDKRNIINSVYNEAKSLVTISSFAKVMGGKRIPKGYGFSVSKTDYPYLRVSDFKNGSVDLSKLKYIDEEVFSKIKQYTISKEDIYISIAGTIGLVGVIPDELDNKSLTENAAKIVLNNPKETLQPFICSMLQSDNSKEQIENRTKALGVPKLALMRIKTIAIPHPSLTKQQEIVSEIKEIETKIAELEKEIKTIPKQKNMIMEKYLE